MVEWLLLYLMGVQAAARVSMEKGSVCSLSLCKASAAPMGLLRSTLAIDLAQNQGAHVGLPS